MIYMNMAEKDDIVHQNKIHEERVRKERRFQKLHTEFNISPHRKLHVLPDKPMSKKVPELMLENSDYLDKFHEAQKEPKEKYTHPQTESQEIGWVSAPLIQMNLEDRRFKFHRQSSDITKQNN
ncbi:protein FAM183A [Thalassophryne amazonica]|uniref:protein FAM183A n=1 Tax=Thalassophryne amazonica TaxID=390379 RepID=UPI001470C6D9|nr:protein FAM183A [Thalassophryne amazonica]